MGWPDLDDVRAMTAERLRRIMDGKYPRMGLVAGFGDVFTRT